jgi:Flp pilus assembly protein TadD
MTMTRTQNPAAPASAPARPGFQPIPTRIRDVRDAQVPPLVVEPANEQQQTLMRQRLGELAQKLAEIHRTAAEAWLMQGSYDQALPHLEAAATFAPGEAEFMHQLGFVRYITGDDQRAIESFNAVLASDPANAEAWFNLGMVLFGLSKLSEAEGCFQRSLQGNPDDAQTWNNRGVCLWKLGSNGDARACFQRALQIDPNDQDAAFNLSQLA